ncbi:Tn3 family transposase [Peribacillus frigoritolerans]|uniref:Tn3 family transposase n=1 Tax=Peribacillus frigoritolerans TaxID=450367 RepID=A0AAJ1QPJ6_9BACI|nr:Tn3 family transposase [Peribacillus frigoritolerans]MDM5285021.1 Tn3 family transposase [Peribacillus frigoritolerans]
MFYSGNRIINSGKAENQADYMLKGCKHVELRERALQDQLHRAIALNIIINAISLDHAEQATKHRKKQGKLQEELLNHIGWEHINFLGEYKFNFRQNSSLDSLRPLKQQEVE